MIFRMCGSILEVEFHHGDPITALVLVPAAALANGQTDELYRASYRLEAAGNAMGNLWEVVRLTALGIARIADGTISFKTVGGPIMLFHIAAQAAEEGLVSVLVAPLFVEGSRPIGVMRVYTGERREFEAEYFSAGSLARRPPTTERSSLPVQELYSLLVRLAPPGTSERQLASALDSDAAPVVLDVRTATEHSAGHIPGARLFPLDDLRGCDFDLPGRRGGSYFHQPFLRHHLDVLLRPRLPQIRRAEDAGNKYERFSRRNSGNCRGQTPRQLRRTRDSPRDQL